MPLSSRFRASWPGWLCLSVLWCLAIFVAGTRGNFPLNDDWSYADTLTRWLVDGHYAPNHWTSMPLLSNLAWGGAFSWVAGLSHDTLRLSTQVAGLAGALAAFELFMLCSRSAMVSLIGAAALMFNPLYLMLANTFMTDVLFTSLFTMGLLAGLANLARPSRIKWGLFCVFCLAATCSRQLGLALAAGYLLTCLSPARPSRTAWQAALALLALCLGALAAHQHFLAASGLSPAMASAQSGRLLDVLRQPKWLVANVFTQGGATVLYLFALASPIWLLTAWPTEPVGATGRQRVILKRCTGGAMAALVLAIGWRQTGHALPWLGNILTTHGLGPFTLPDVEHFNLAAPDSVLPAWWPALTALGMVGVVVGVALLAGRMPSMPWSRMARSISARHWMLVGTGMAYLTPLLISGMFDRYLLALVPIMGALLLTRPARHWQLGLATLCLTVMSLTTVALVHDHFSWQRARWALVDVAKNKHHITDAELNAGFEHDTARFYLGATADSARHGFKWQARPYKVTFRVLPGHEVIDTQPWSAWLSPSRQTLYLLKEAS